MPRKTGIRPITQLRRLAGVSVQSLLAVALATLAVCGVRFVRQD